MLKAKKTPAFESITQFTFKFKIILNYSNIVQKYWRLKFFAAYVVKILQEIHYLMISSLKKPEFLSQVLSHYAVTRQPGMWNSSNIF